MLFRSDQHLEDERKMHVRLRLRLQRPLRIPDKTELRRNSSVYYTESKLIKIHGTGIELYMRIDGRTGMVQLIGAFLKLFFENALQMIQHLPIGGLT
jgi:hypothetical protein